MTETRAEDPRRPTTTTKEEDAGNILAFFYDGAGRLIGRGPRAKTGPLESSLYTQRATDYVYTYDSAVDQGAACQRSGFRQGRLAAVQEPTDAVLGVSSAVFCYDALRRELGSMRSIGSKAAVHWNALSASGLVLREQADDGFIVYSDYDRAGRLAMLSDADGRGNKGNPIWAASAGAASGLDAAGRVISESYGQRVLGQGYVRDGLGLPIDISVARLGQAAPLYHVGIGRNLYGAPEKVTDLPGRAASAIDHNATYAYDGAARLTNAILGPTTAPWKFRFEYDGLQNMIGRTQEAPAGRTSLNIASGTYRYGENAGPRQLTSVVQDCVRVVSTYTYDGAGRLETYDSQHLEYDGYDQLTRVTKNGADLVKHSYGYDGLRTYTLGAGNAEQYWFASNDTLLPGGTIRSHYVSVGDRLVARLSFPQPTGTPAFPPQGAVGATLWPRIEARAPRYFVTTTGSLALLLLAWAGWRRRRPLWQTAPAVVGSAALMLTAPGCDHAETHQFGLEQPGTRRYFHQGVAAGPTLITDGGGTVIDERRFEPFGEPIDANMDQDPYNSLNKETEKETGWSYHGARWMAPQTARWLTPDPPVKAPEKGFMAEPWGLNPYSYVKQSPTTHWDPDGGIPAATEIMTVVQSDFLRVMSLNRWEKIGASSNDTSRDLPLHTSASGMRRGSVEGAMCHERVNTPLRNTTGLEYKGPKGQNFGQAEVISALEAVGRAWRQAHGSDIGIGAISAVGGGPLVNSQGRNHLSHQEGLNVDIYLFNQEGGSFYGSYSDPRNNYSRELTQELVDLLRSQTKAKVESILFNDPGVSGVEWFEGHAGHLHVTFQKSPSAESKQE